MTQDAVQIRLTLENEQLTRSLRKTERDFARLEAKAKKSSSGISEAFIGAAKGITAAFLSVEAIRGFGNAMVSTAKAVADLNDNAKKVGISFQAFQELQFTASQTGISVEALTTSIAKLQTNLGKMAATGNDAALEKLGLSIKAIINLAPERQFEVIIDALAGVKNPAERAAIAAELFGRGFKELNPLIAEGAGALDRFAQQAQDLGVVLSDVTRDQMAQFDDAMELLSLQVQAAKADAFLPLITFLTGDFKSGMTGSSSVARYLGDEFVVLAGKIEMAGNGLEFYARVWEGMKNPEGRGLAEIIGEARDAERAADKLVMDRVKAAQALADYAQTPKSGPSRRKVFEDPLNTAVGDEAGDRAEAAATKAAARAASARASSALKESEQRAKALAEAAKREAEAYVASFNEAIKSSQQATFEAEVSLGSIGAENTDQIKLAVDLANDLAKVQAEYHDAELAALEAELLKRYEINSAILTTTDATEKAAESSAENARQLEAIGANVGRVFGDAFASIVTGAQSAEDAVRQLLAAILTALVQAAILSAFTGKGFGDSLGGIIGGYTPTTAAPGASVRIYNNSGGLVTTRQRGNNTDVYIGQLATAVNRGGNQLDKALRNTYGIKRRGV